MILAPARPQRSAFLRLAAFAPLCAFAAAHWAALVSDPPVWRLGAVVGVATACGGGLLASARLDRRDAGAAWTARSLIVAAAGVAAFAAVGLSPALLAPGGWSELAAGLGVGFDGLVDVEWPYGGGDAWVRLTVLLAVPPAAILAATLAFWPQASGAGGPEVVAVRQAAALGVLLSLLAVAAAERPLPAALERGALLLVLLAGWLFPPELPRLRSKVALAAGASVLVVGLVALPLAAALEPDRPWIDYRSWELWGGGSPPGIFDWDHSYGPIDWPRTGDTMLEVRSRRPQYWRVEALDRFDGYAWRSSGRRRTGGAAVELPLASGLEERWRERLGFTVRGLNSGVLAAAGTPLAVEGAGRVAVFADGTAEPLGRPPGPGDSYRVSAYVPNPSAREMRAATDPAPPPFARDYTEIHLPPSAAREATAVERAGTAGPLGESLTPPDRVRLGVAGDSAAADPGAQERILASPYADVYRLSRRLARGQATSYDTVRAIERHLRRGYDYDERPPAREHPLAAFLLSDRAGYCQQFSGAMALMLRMNRIPARVATGFAPGLRQPRGRWRVRDLDAHSWVEVLFPGIGWVAFDPTPSGAPAERPGDDAEADAAASASAAGRERRRPRRREAEPEPRPIGDRPASGAPARNGNGVSPAAAALVLLSLCAVAAGAWRLGVPAWLRKRARRERSPEEEVAELRTALERLGYEIYPGTTLAALEDRLVERPGPAAARYVRRLRERRFAVPPPGGSAPRLDRRALRRALTAELGPVGWLRGFLALPPAVLVPRR